MGGALAFRIEFAAPARGTVPPVSAAAVVLSVNVGLPRTVEWRGRAVRTSIWKEPVEGPVRVEGVNLAGDAQADRRVHGGPDKAVYAYSRSDLDWWQQQLDRPLPNGVFGENLTIAGMDLNRALIGERWRVGNVLLEVSQPRTPCYKLGIRLGDDTFPARFAEAGRPGAYLRILEEGLLRRGDPVVVESRPSASLTVAEVADIYGHQPHRAAELLALPALAEVWREWARRRLAASRPGVGPQGKARPAVYRRRAWAGGRGSEQGERWPVLPPTKQSISHQPVFAGSPPCCSAWSRRCCWRRPAPPWWAWGCVPTPARKRRSAPSLPSRWARRWES